MPKFATLKNPQLKDILRVNKLPTAGNKNEMVARLIKELKVDEISEEELNEIESNDDGLQTQIDDLKKTMQELVSTLQNITASQNEPPEEDDANENRSHVSSRRGSNEPPMKNAVDLISFSSSRQSVTPSAINEEVTLPSFRGKFSVKEIAETIPEFNPTDERSVSVEQFVDHIESAVEAYNFDVKCLLLAVSSRLRGAARSWLDGQTQLFRTWKTFKAALLDEFGIELNEAEINYKLAACVRRPDEKVADYCFRIQALGRRYGLSEVAVIRYARDGLKNRELQNAIAVMKFRTMKEFRKTLEDYNINAPTTSRYPTNTPINRPTTTKYEPREPVKVENTRSKEVVCYNCNEKGHISRNCTKPQKKERCTICQKTSHKAEQCYQRNQDGANKKPNVNAICETDNTYSEVVKGIKLNGRQLKAFLDSGSAISLVRESAILESDNAIACNTVLQGFAGGKYVSEKKINATLEMDDHTFQIQLNVVKDHDIPEKVLIGRDVLCKEGHRFVMEKGECQIQTMTITRYGENLTTTQQRMLDDLIETNRKCFSENITELGKCSSAEMEIKLTTQQPVNVKPYRIAFAKRNIVEDIVNDLMKNEIIRPSKSDYASPVVLVEKKNGEHRLCVDYRCLNKITVRTPFPMPVLEEQFTQLAGHKFFTSLDLRMGYHQIAVSEASKKYTAFITTQGHYEFNRMPFGLVNAPAVFQRVINIVLSELKPGEALAYLDDIVIPSKTVEEGLQSLHNFLQALARHGLTLRPDKCCYLQPEIQYLGHIINHEGLKPGKSKISAIENFKIPENITEVRRFLGLTGFFRKFVADYALITRPITKLLSKGEQDNFQWNDERQSAFETLINKLTNAPILELYDVNKQHEVHTDACSIGLAGILLQSSDAKTWKTVMYFSRRCTAAEQKYHSHELEVLAVVETLQRFRLYLLGKTFRVITDCAAIALTKEQRELKPRIARWWLRLQEFDFVVQHRPGNRLAHVDALSRSPDEPPKTPEPAGFVYTIGMELTDWVAAMQQQDERAKLISNVLLGQVQTAEDKQLKRDYILKNQRLYHKNGADTKLYIPKSIRWGLVAHFHDNMGHFATDKTLQRVRTLFWFPKMRKLVKEYIKACIQCCYYKSNNAKTEGELHYNPPEPIPFRLLHIDHLGPFIRSKKGNSYLLVITDAFSKFSIIKPVRNTKTVGVINVLNEIISYFGLPAKVITDRGTAFTSKAFEQFCEVNGIGHVKNAVRTPRANGQVERTNATILNAIRCSTANAKDWDAELGKLQWVLNSQPNSTTKFTPNQIVFNYDIKDAVHNHLVAAVSSDIMNDKETLPSKDVNAQVLANIENERAKWKKRFDEKHAKPTIYREHDLVVIKAEPPATGESRKLEPKYKGPYAVSRVLGRDRYLIEDVPGMQVSNRKFCSVFASHMMKPWCDGYPDLITGDTPEDEDVDDANDDEDSDDPSEK